MIIKPLSEQNLMKNYVFPMVMREPKRIKPLLDQTTDQKNLPRRMRYYQGMLDIAFFPAGADYNQMQ